MFKVDWEKTSIKQSLAESIIEQMLALAYPKEKLISHTVIYGGCANLNIKIQLKDKKQPFILRIYLRDKEAAYREQKLSALLKKILPIPLTYYIGQLQGYTFALTEFMPGITLRDLLLGACPHDLSAIMYEVGIMLDKITEHSFSSSGFFDQDLNIIRHSPSDDYLIFTKDCLKNKSVLSLLKSDIIFKIEQFLNNYSDLFPDKNEKNLVHADFDPANILVSKVDSFWKISGILDWEFAFSGSMLHDVANMLRYAHKMPPAFENAFLEGLKSRGLSLPNNWQTRIQLLNLFALLDCLKRSDPKNSPKQVADILRLIEDIIY